VGLGTNESPPMKIEQKHLVESISSRLSEKGIKLSSEDLREVLDLTEDEMVYGYANRLITQADRIFGIGPGLTDDLRMNRLRFSPFLERN